MFISSILSVGDRRIAWYCLRAVKYPQHGDIVFKVVFYKRRTQFSTGKFLLLVDISEEVGDFETSVTETEELNNIM